MTTTSNVKGTSSRRRADSKSAHYEKACKAVAAYLRAHGWTVMVIGGCKVIKPIGERRLNYEVNFRMTGVAPAGKDDELQRSWPNGDPA